MVRAFLAVLILSFAVPHAFASDFTVQRFVGPPIGPGSYDGEAGFAALTEPVDLAQDHAGNFYFIDSSTELVRRIGVDGSITTLAGLLDSNAKSSMTVGRGAEATFMSPDGIAVDSNGMVYVSDGSANAIRKITPSGVVTTFVSLGGPGRLVFDSADNLYAVAGDCTVSKITPSGVRTILAGVSFQCSARDGNGSDARFLLPHGIALTPDGDLLIVDGRIPDYQSGRLCRVKPDGTVTTIATFPGFAYDVAVDATGAAYVSLGFSERIAKVANGAWSYYAGNGEPQHRDGSIESASFIGLRGLLLGNDGDLYIADAGSAAIRKIAFATSLVSTIAGGKQSGVVNGNRTTARLDYPHDVAFDSNGTAYVADNAVIRKITSDGTTTTFVTFPAQKIAVGADGTIYASYGNAIYKISPQGEITLLAGSVAFAGSVHTNGASEGLGEIRGIAVAQDGMVYVADSNKTIRKITPSGDVTTIAGVPGISGVADGTGSGARFTWLKGIAMNASGAMYVLDNQTIRKVTFSGEVTTVAGEPGETDTTDGTGSAARMVDPRDLVVASDGTVYFTDWTTLREMSPAGVVKRVAGTFGLSERNVFGTGANAHFSLVLGLGIDPDNRVFVVDRNACSLNVAVPAGIEDAATVTPAPTIAGVPAIAPLGTTFQLSTDFASATSWEWRVVRRPSSSTAQLSATNIRNPTFTPDVPDLYTFLLRAENSSGVRYSLIEVWPTTSCIPLASVVASVNGSFSTNVCPPSSGGSAIASVTGGGALAYQWSWSDTPDGVQHTIDGATNATYTIEPADFDGFGTKYLAVTVTPSCGAAIRSNAIVVNISGLAIDLPDTIYAGSFYKVSVTTPIEATSYSWSTNGTPASNEFNRTFMFFAPQSGDLTLNVSATKDGCTRSIQRTIAVMPRPQGSTMFYMVTPCRLYDSRNVGGPVPSTWRDGIVPSVKNCAIPFGAKAVAVNVVAVSPSGTGFLALYGETWSGTSTLNYRAGKTRASSTIVPIAPGGAFTVYNVGASTHFIVDVTGFFQ